MFRKRMTIVIVVLFSLAAVIPAHAAAPETGTVYEGVSVPGAALGDSRAQVLESYGAPNNCVDYNVLGAKDHCTYEVEGGGEVGVSYRGPDGGEPSGSPDDVVTEIRWDEAVDEWVTTAGVNTTLVRENIQAVLDAYPDAEYRYRHGAVVGLIDYDLGIQIGWGCVYIFCPVAMRIFTPFTPPPPPDPDLIRVADIEMSYDRRTVTAKVLVLDEDNQPVEGAVVGVFWVYPINKNNNTNMFTDATTAGDGYAAFRIGDNARPGDYRITISYVTKEGFEFDHDNSIKVGTITKPK